MTPTPQELKARSAIAKAMERLDPESRDRVLARVSDLGSREDVTAALDAELAQLRKQIKEVDAQVAKDVRPLEEHKAALQRIKPWLEAQTFALQKNDCSRLHKLHEAFRAGRVMQTEFAVAPMDSEDMMGRSWISHAHPFVVEHDWAAAFKGATDYDEGVFDLPFDVCAFEFRINERAVIVTPTRPEHALLEPQQLDDVKWDTPYFSPCYVDCGGGWWWAAGQMAAKNPFLAYAWSQIRAICIALDAEIAGHDIQRAPVALNEKRTRKGEPPLYDYHVVKLRGRQVRQQLPSAGGTHRSPRLHFRRGHWRHYESHKTWIRWMLVGDPELGFVDKAYRL